MGGLGPEGRALLSHKDWGARPTLVYLHYDGGRDTLPASSCFSGPRGFIPTLQNGDGRDSAGRGGPRAEGQAPVNRAASSISEPGAAL